MCVIIILYMSVGSSFSHHKNEIFEYYWTLIFIKLTFSIIAGDDMCSSTKKKEGAAVMHECNNNCTVTGSDSKQARTHVHKVSWQTNCKAPCGFRACRYLIILSDISFALSWPCCGCGHENDVSLDMRQSSQLYKFYKIQFLSMKHLRHGFIAFGNWWLTLFSNQWTQRREMDVCMYATYMHVETISLILLLFYFMLPRVQKLLV